MLRTRLPIGLAMVAAFLLVMWIDEHFAPWYPLWFVAVVVVIGHSALEVVGLLNETSARPSGNTVFGGVMAMVVANWAPHVLAHLSEASYAVRDTMYHAAAPIDVLAWPLWTF